jgi:hypothetical protein
MSASTAPNRHVHLGSLPTSSTRHFVRHLIEMVLAMWVGMLVLGGLDRGILAAAGTSVSSQKSSAPEVVALVMAFNMTVGMTLWMRHRHHSWAMCAEMAGAMFVPAIAAIVLFWCAVINSGSILAVEHLPMLPAMVAVMLFRRTEYSQPVHAQAREAAGQRR